MLLSISRYVLVAVSILFIAFISLRKKQDKKLNWAFFYSVLWITISLGIVNYICVNLGYWSFYDNPIPSIKIPFDIFFVWIVFWGVIPIFFIGKKYFPILVLVLFWLDLLLMPKLEELGLLHLSDKWLVGEVIIILIVTVPSYVWAYCSYHNIRIGLRAVFQVIIMGGIFIIGLPFIIYSYGLIPTLNYRLSMIELQLFVIITFPSLVAVYDLVTKGEGTPFPYDATKNIVRTGVYAYCRNPIQWSFTLIFVPLSIYHSSYILLIGSLVSIAYAVGVSDFQEYPDMEKRYGDSWIDYKNNVPKWYFLWKPKGIPQGKIYFDANCNQCSQIKQWFSNKELINLELKSSSEFTNSSILQVTYVDYMGKEYRSVKAIASAIEHINLGFASLGWFMRFPIINYLLQAIVDSMDFGKHESCKND